MDTVTGNPELGNVHFKISPTKSTPFSGIFLLSLVIIWGLVYIWKKTSRSKRDIALINKFDGPPALPILGNIVFLLGFLKDLLVGMDQITKKYSDPVRIWRLNHPMIFISTFEVASQLLNSPDFIGKPVEVEAMNGQENLPGVSGISTAPPHIHRIRRKQVTAGFGRQAIENSIPIFVEETKKIVKMLEPRANTGIEFDMIKIFMPSGFRALSRSAFGDEIIAGIADDEGLKHMNAFHTLMRAFVNRYFTPYFWVRNDFIYYNLTGEGKTTAKCIKRLNDFGRQAIKKARASPREITVRDRSYIDLLLELEKSGEISEEDVLHELNNFIAAGYDTTATTAAWTLYCLAKHPEEQEKVVQELEQVFGTREENPTEYLETTMATTKHLKFLEMCIKETLRMYATVTVVPRRTLSDTVLKDGRVIPANLDVYVLQGNYHMEPEHFPEPEKFIPERHEKPIPAFTPFSLGARNCIGQVYAMHNLKVEIAYLVREYKWESRDVDAQISYGLYVPKGDMKFKITKR